MSTAFTFYFNDVIDSYNTWKSNVEQLGIIDYSDPLQADFDLFCYNILAREYHNVNIRYDEPYSFIGELLNIYLNKFQQFYKQKQLIDAMYNLTLEEISLLNKTLSNMANNPNEDPTDPTQPLNFISAQTYRQLTENKFKAYLKAIENIPSLNIYNFLKGEGDEMGFDDLFMVVQPNLKFLYKE